MDRYDDDELDPVLKTVVSHWMTKIQHARKHKQKVFQDDANECQSFFDGPKNWDEVMAGGAGMDASDGPVNTTFKVSVNKTFEFVTIFGPALYYENPVRTVKPRMPVVVPPQFFGPLNQLLYQSLIQQENLRVQAEGLTSVLIESYLNWTPSEFDLESESRSAIDEGLIKGRGCLWTELYSPPATDMRVVRSIWDSTNNLLCDPDAHSFKKAYWIARKCVHPVWQVERDYGLRPGSIKGNMESQAKQSDVDADEDQQYDRLRGNTNDLLVYYKIFSRMGIGGRLQGMKQDLKAPLEMFGDYVYLAIADGVPFPLNLNPDLTSDKAAIDPQLIFSKLAWPTPFWAADEWPVSPLDFHTVHNSPWPMPHLKAGMGELKFLNWCMSFLMGKIRNTSRDFVAIKKEAGEEIKAEILGGKDLTLLELESSNGTITDLVQFLQHPTVNGDIWKMIESVEANFDKRVGLTELMYGQQGATQIRSAQEANLRNQNMNVRPDDMRKCVASWMARVSLKEALCARYHLLDADVQPVLGGMASWAWKQFVSTRDLNVACRQLEYRIEAGSTARPNKEWEAQTMNTAFTALSPVFEAYAQQTMDMTPLNNLITDLAKSLDLDPSRYQLRTPLAPPAPPEAPGGDPNQPQNAGHQSPASTNVPPPG